MKSSRKIEMMSGFFGYILRLSLRQIRGKLFGLLLVAFAIQMPLGAFLIAYSWLDARELDRFVTEGAQADATIEKVDVDLGRGWKIVKLKLAWSDAEGKIRRQAVRLDEDFVSKILLGDRIVQSRLPIKYLPADPNANILLLDTADHRRGINISAMKFGAIIFALGAIGIAILHDVRRYVRTSYPALPISFTSWPDVRGQMRQSSSLIRLLLQYKYLAIIFLTGLTYGLKCIGLFAVLESLTGLSESWAGLVFAIGVVATLSIGGWYYDRYCEWRASRGIIG